MVETMPCHNFMRVIAGTLKTEDEETDVEHFDHGKELRLFREPCDAISVQLGIQKKLHN